MDFYVELIFNWEKRVGQSNINKFSILFKDLNQLLIIINTAIYYLNSPPSRYIDFELNYKFIHFHKFKALSPPVQASKCKKMC